MEQIDVRTKMRMFRKERDIPLKVMEKVCECSAFLLKGIEVYGWITHPKIATRIANAYKLDLDGYNAIIPRSYAATKLPTPKPAPKRFTWESYRNILKEEK